MNQSDKALEDVIKSAQQGNAEAFECLLDQHYDIIYRVAYRWRGNKADAEDITQQACIKLAQGIKQYRFEASFSSWLYRLVINCAKDWGKSQQRHKSDGEESLQNIEDPNANNGEHSVYLVQVLRLLDSMAEGFKETALLVFAEGRNHAEAAEVLGVKESTISWRIHEIRKQLKASLSEVSQ